MIFPYKGRLVVRNSLYIQQLIGGFLRGVHAVATSPTDRGTIPAGKQKD